MPIAIPNAINKPIITHVGQRVVEITMVSLGVYLIKVDNILLSGTFSDSAVAALERKLLNDDDIEIKTLRYRLKGLGMAEGWVTG